MQFQHSMYFVTKNPDGDSENEKSYQRSAGLSGKRLQKGSSLDADGIRICHITVSWKKNFQLDLSWSSHIAVGWKNKQICLTKQPFLIVSQARHSGKGKSIKLYPTILVSSIKLSNYQSIKLYRTILFCAQLLS